jgi:hypothetical protein
VHKHLAHDEKPNNVSMNETHTPAEDAAPGALEEQPVQDALEGVADEEDAAGAAAQGIK